MQQVPKQVWADLEYEVARHDLDCADNFRAYRVSDGYGFETYQRAADTGCCGYFEGSTVVDGQKWIIGCNYGH